MKFFRRNIRKSGRYSCFVFALFLPTISWRCRKKPKTGKWRSRKNFIRIGTSNIYEPEKWLKEELDDYPEEILLDVLEDAEFWLKEGSLFIRLPPL